MSRRDKQADLRRRMAEARSKLASLPAADAPRVLDPPPAAGRKRPLPPASAGGGGILRKSKYTSAAAPVAAAPTPVDAPEIKRGGKGDEAENGALGSLMAGYDDSSSDDEGGAAPLPSPSVVPKTDGAPSAPAKGGGSKESSSADGGREGYRQKVQFGEGAIDETAKLMQQTTPSGVVTEKPASLGKSATTFAEEPHSKAGNNDAKSAEVSDEVWDEFNALLDDNDDDDAKAADGASPTTETPATTEAAEAVEAAVLPKAAKKKSKKKKKKGKKERNPYDNDNAMSTVEQASYEARLGRLMLLTSQKGRRDRNETGDPAAEEEFYDGGLAFRQDGGNEPSGGASETSNTALEALGNGEGMPPSSGEGAAPNVPLASLAGILREKRDRARQMSSRGNDATNSGEDADGCWF